MENERPPVGDPLALYWVLGTIDAARGTKYEECYFKDSRKELWQRGYKAYVAEKKVLKTNAVKDKPLK